MNIRRSSYARLNSPWNYLVRGVWVVYTLSTLVVVMISSIRWARIPLPSNTEPVTFNQAAYPSMEDAQLSVELGLAPGLLRTAVDVGSIIARTSMFAVAILIFAGRSDDWVALLTGAAMTSILLEGVLLQERSLQIVAEGLFWLGTVLWMPLPFVFPDGRFVPRWSRWATLGLIVGVCVSTVLNVDAGLTILAGIWVVLAVVANVYRYRRVSSQAERLQTWLLVTSLVAILISSTTWLVFPVIWPHTQATPDRVVALLVEAVIYMTCYGTFSACLAAAILRYRLWDIQVIVRRTLIYGTVTLLLALVYFGGVAILQSLFSSLTNNRSSLTVVISTLGIASLFSPLRQRVQRFIDRRFYRRKYDAQKMLEQFSARMRDEVDLDRMTVELLDVAEKTMQPRAIGLWLVSDTRPESEAL